MSWEFSAGLSAIEGQKRFPLQFKVRYCSFPRTAGFSGDGWVVDVSSGGALVISENELLIGAKIELAMEWPSLLDGNIPLKIVARGSVVRFSPESFAVKFQRYQFRTLKRVVQTFEDPTYPRQDRQMSCNRVSFRLITETTCPELPRFQADSLFNCQRLQQDDLQREI